MPRNEQPASGLLRKVLNPLSTVEAMELLLADGFRNEIEMPVLGRRCPATT